jgi:ABC-type Mn2+/Zn2+ transport system permease subunit
VSASDTTTHFFVLSVPAPALLFVFLLLAAQGLHGFLTALHQAGRLHQQGTMFHSGASGSAAGYFLRHPLKFLIKTLLVNVIYMIYMMFLSTLNKRTIDVTNIMIMLFFWIKLNLKLPNFLSFS